MADRTDQFNPYLQPKDMPDFTASSRGADPARHISSNKTAHLLEGIGGLFNAGVKFADDVIKENISSEARTEVEEARDSQLGGLDREATLSNPLLPKEVKSQLERTQQLTQARENGRLGDSYYWAQMDIIARRLRNRYPGHKDYVDTYISGLVGGTPANRLRESLQSDIASAQSGGIAKDMKQFDEDVMKGNVDAPGYVESLQTVGQEGSFATKEEAYLHYKNVAMQRGAQLANRKAERDRIETKQKVGEDTRKDALDLGRKTVWEDIYHQLYTVHGSKLGVTMEQTQAVLRNAQTAASEGQPVDTPGLTAKLNELRTLMLQNVEKTLMDPMYSTLGREGKQDIRQSVEDFLSSQFDAVARDKTGFISWNKNFVEAIQSNAAMMLLQNERAQILAGVRENFGDIIANKFLSDNKDLLHWSGQFANQYVRGSAYNIEKPTSLKKAIGVAKGISANPKSYIYSLHGLSEDMSNINELSDAGVSSLVNYLYGPDNYDVFAEFNDGASRHEAFRLLANSTNAQKIFERDKRTPGIWAAYKSWTFNGFTKLFPEDMANMNEINVNRRNIDVQWDSVNFELKVVPHKPAPGEKMPTEIPLSGFLERNWLEPNARDAINRVNTTIKGLVGIAQAEGKDPNAVLGDVFKLFGLTPTGAAPAGAKVGPAWDNLLSEVRETLGMLPSAAKQEKEEKQKETPKAAGDTTINGIW